MYVELVGFGKGGCHFPDVEEDRWGKKKGMESVSRRALRRGTPTTVVGTLVRVGRYTGVAAPILTLSENRGPRGDKEGGATLPSLLCAFNCGHGACYIVQLESF